MRARGLFLSLIAALAAFAAPGTTRAEDGSPPVGTLEIENGVGYTHDRALTLDVPAVDDVGVVTVLVGLAGGEMTEFAYAPRIEWSIPDGVGEQSLNIAVWWRDAAGNTSTAQDTVLFDGTPPSFSTFKATTSEPGPPGTITFSVGADDPTSGVAAIRFSTDHGAHWGAEIGAPAPIVFWNPRDPAIGGKANALGPVTVMAKIRDAAFNWSKVRSTTVNVTRTLEIDVSSSPTTGQSITFTPDWSGPVAFPAGTHCMWEFMTGDDASLFHGNHNDSFSYNLTQGPASGSWCGPWTFTLPWSTVRQYLVAYRVMFSDGSEMNAMLGDSPGATSFTSSVGSTSRAIKTSNLPLIYVLPDDELTVGVPATYRAFAIGGATIKSSDRWNILQAGALSGFYPGAASFTFTPQRAGHITVCLSRGPGSTPMDRLGACIDPTVKRASGSGGSTPAPGATNAGSSFPTETAIASSSAGETGVPVTGTLTPTQVAVAGANPGSGSAGPITVPIDVVPAADPGPALALLGLLLALGTGIAIAWSRGWRPRGAPGRPGSTGT